MVAPSSPANNKSVPRLALLMVIACGLYWLISLSIQMQQRGGTSSTGIVTDKQHQHYRGTISVEQKWARLSLPIVPSIKIDNATSAKAMKDFFQYTTTTATSNNNENGDSGGGGGGWINANALTFEDIAKIRQLGRDIMSRETNCGRPRLSNIDNSISNNNAPPPQKEAELLLATGLEYCFWIKDYVSERAMDNFGFEPELWKWVVRQYRNLPRELETYHLLPSSSSSSDTTTTATATAAPAVAACQLAFLDLGVNVGDWASPLRLALPDTPYFGIEGTPSTGAIATANLRTSIEHHLRANRSVAPSALLPFSVVSRSMLEQVRQTGGVCFGQDFSNVGGQGIDTTTSRETRPCLPSLIAGGTLLPHALQALVPLQEPSCPGRKNVADWPRVYIAKLDIQGFEFKALVSAMDWLVERPPCYIMIEMQQVPQNSAIMELLLDLGYDSVWRTHNAYAHNETFLHEEFPPNAPYWGRLQNQSLSLHEAVAADMKTLDQFWYYKDYIFGFENKEQCLRRLLE